MLRSHHLIATACLTTLAVGLLAPTRADNPQPPRIPTTAAAEYPPGATDAEKREIDLRWFRGNADAEARKKLLAAFPFESLESRLKFDPIGRARVAKTFPTGELDFDKWKTLPSDTTARTKIPPAVATTLMTEERLRREGIFDRVRALAALHEVKVQEFVTNPGFGHMRLIPTRYPKPETQPKDWSEADRGEPVTLPKAGGFFDPNPDKTGPTLPSVIALTGFHTSTTHEFIRPDSWGLVKDKTQVAGFRPHTLDYIPDDHARRRFDLDKPTKDKDGRVISYPLIERWAVRKVELVGLLMHDVPVVYLNPEGKLPAMKAAKEAGTRELTEFESNGLKDLAAGKEFVSVDATTNHLRMVGAIRMADACMKCHDGKRGDLLGAFSYDLVRDPAFVPVQK
jgi:hypothetical protein